ncbi:GNAT family N-acetyltransferase [Rhodococcus spongiicola]|nr:GNAT family N-acetyltransferase [Rhodococcus spongiicola]
MTSEEYERTTQAREAEVVRELRASMSEEEAWVHTKAGTAKYLPDGLATERHHLVVAVDGNGVPVGDAWIGPDPHRGPDATDSSWLYDINAYPQFRRQGFGSAILAAAEALVANEGAETLGLNVFGANTGAAELYRRNGYEIASMQLTKKVAAS